MQTKLISPVWVCRYVWDLRLPNRVGVPKIIASASVSFLTVQPGVFENAFYFAIAT
ncbi:MAG: hypothetical protein HGJ92_02635 [Desulfobacteraceae bacterium]|nr:hypothetical protein [Desulfobacteraceae bacterium]